KVSLLLPAAQADGAEAPLPFAESAPQSIAGATVLLVEDDESLGDVTAALLMAHGARVVRAGDADAALRLLDAGVVPEVLLSDIVMPGSMDGVGLARRLRQQHPGLPVVLITGFSNTVMAEGEFPVLRKPCPPAEMLAALQAAMASRRANGHPAAPQPRS
ncbi:response regulator, partial [Roseateles sp.]